jgi:hypothetical protein
MNPNFEVYRVDIANPYSEFDNHKYIVNIGRIKELCFNLSNIFYAHQMMMQNYEESIIEWQEENTKKMTPENFEIVPEILKLHNEIAFTQITNHLFELAILFRVLDDQRKREGNKTYLDNLSKVDVSSLGTIGNCGDASYVLRYCCNKIIHHENIIQIYNRKDTSIEVDIEINEYSSEIEMKGEESNGKKWHETLNIFEFIGCILMVL